MVANLLFDTEDGLGLEIVRYNIGGSNTSSSAIDSMRPSGAVPSTVMADGTYNWTLVSICLPYMHAHRISRCYIRKIDHARQSNILETARGTFCKPKRFCVLCVLSGHASQPNTCNSACGTLHRPRDLFLVNTHSTMCPVPF